MHLSGMELARATGGHWHGSVPVRIGSVSTDTRSLQQGDLFLALRGPNFDGHACAATVAERALALVGDHQGIQGWSDLANSKLEVADTLRALGDIARCWRERLQHTTVIAISGSYGKTSLRALLQTGFQALGLKVAATKANLNNLIGVPQTLLAVPHDADVAVIECGISERGEMARLAGIVAPDIALLTGISAAHAEGLGGLAGVVREKAALLAGMQGSGWCVLGEGVGALLREHGTGITAMPERCVMQGEQGAVRWQLTGCGLQLHGRGQHASIQLALPAAHWAANMALAATLIWHYMDARGSEISLGDIAAALADWQPPGGRMQLCSGRGGARILDDSYNANPVSMQAAVNTLRQLDGRRIAILGDMAELGEDAAAAHAGIDVQGLDAMYLVGEHMRELAEKQQSACWYASTDALLAALEHVHFGPADHVLVKASRCMQLDVVVRLLCQQKECTDAV